MCRRCGGVPHPSLPDGDHQTGGGEWPRQAEYHLHIYTVYSVQFFYGYWIGEGYRYQIKEKAGYWYTTIFGSAVSSVAEQFYRYSLRSFPH